MATQKKEPIKKVEEEKSDDAKLVEEIREVVQAKEVKEEKSEIDLLKERLAQLEQSNAMLLEISDNKSKAFFYDKNQEKLPTNMNVRSYGGKIIIGWKSIVDDVDRDMITGRYMEKQETMVFFQDGTTKQLPIILFEKHTVPIKCKVLSVLSSTEDNTISYKLKRYDNGEELEIGASFVN